jgi:transposase
MSHRNARLTPRGRQLLVERVRVQGMPVAHVAKAMGISRQCAHRWVRRFDEEGLAGLEDRTSRPGSCPNATGPKLVAKVLRVRREERCGPAEISATTGVPERTVTRILRRHGVARLPECDPMTGEVIRASRSTALRYERARPGELVHIDVKKLGKIPDGGGWRANGRGPRPVAKRHLGYDYVHSMVDDHSRFAYSEILADEQGATCAGFLERAATGVSHRWHRCDCRGDERQRLQLHPQHRFQCGAQSSRCQAPPHQTPLPVAERQGGETQSHTADRMGLSTRLSDQCATASSPAKMASALQHRAPPQRTWRPATSQPPVMKVVAEYT